MASLTASLSLTGKLPAIMICTSVVAYVLLYISWLRWSEEGRAGGKFRAVVSVLIFSPGRSGEIEIFHCAVLTHLGDVILASVPSKLLTEELAGLHSLLDRS